MKFNWRFNSGLRTACASALAALALTSTPTSAQINNGVFAIDGNAGATCGGAFPGSFGCTGDDWTALYSCTMAGCTKNTPQSGNSAAVISDPMVMSTPNKIFTGGGSKDGRNITQWRWTAGTVPDKDELVASYAALYAPSGGKQIYFAANRYAVNGDAMIGTWFLQNTVMTKSDGTFVDYKGNPATHKIGDVLILSDFTNGGGETTIQVFRVNALGPATCPAGSMWSAAGAGDVCLEMVLEGTSGNNGACNAAGIYPANSACAATNPASAQSLDPTFMPKSGPAGYYPTVGFFEGGLDLVSIGAAGSCFATVLIETRSSSSVDAVLKDFQLGAFQDCTASIKTEIHSKADNSDADLQNTAIDPGVPLHDLAIVSSNSPLNPVPTGTVTFKVYGQPNCTGAFTTETVSLTVGSLDARANSSEINPALPPGYSWLATYNGDGLYDPVTGVCETITVNKGNPTLVTTPNPASGVIGVALADSAVLAGGLNTPSGSIVFKLFDPDSPTCAAGKERFTWTTSVSGNGTYDTAAPPFTTDKAGTWRWTADYSGDASNNPASSGCDKELVVVDKATPAMSTAPKIAVVNNDSATLTGLKGATPGGTLTFKLFQNADCSGTEIFKQDVTVTGNATYSTSNAASILVTADTQFRWTVAYSGDSNNYGATSACSAESVVIDVTP